jgi:hypothetical protein
MGKQAVGFFRVFLLCATCVNSRMVFYTFEHKYYVIMVGQICVKALFVIFKTHPLGMSNFCLGQVVGKNIGFCPVFQWRAIFAELSMLCCFD